MYSTYLTWNRKMIPLLWVLVVIGMLAAMPVAYDRWQSEGTGKQVEIILDYQDLMTIAEMQANPGQFVQEQLTKAKAAGVTSLAIYDSTLTELKSQRRIQLFNSRDGALLSQKPLNADNNYTYLLFNSLRDEEALEPLIREAFELENVVVGRWTSQGLPGLVIQQSYEAATLVPIPMDQDLVKSLTAKGFHVVPRLSDSRSFNEQITNRTLGMLAAAGADRIVFTGESVTGFKERTTLNSLNTMARLMNQHNFGTVYIELLKTPQQGISALSYLTNYNTARLHYLPDDKTTESPSAIADRFVLAVKDRSIRMIYLNANAARDPLKGTMTNSLNNAYSALQGPDGVVKRLTDLGYTFGPAKPFEFKETQGETVLKMLMLIGATALIALTLGMFLQVATTGSFIIGLIGAIGLSVLSDSMASKLLALGAATMAPTLAIILAIRSVRRHQEIGRSEGWSTLIKTFVLFIRTSAISLIGAVFTVGLLNHPTYKLGLDLFRGVSLLHAAPIALVVLYALFFSRNETLQQIDTRIRQFLNANIKVYWVVLAGIAGVGALYYMSRTGNSGVASPIEMLFRGYLEDAMGVRPRTKEFLISHPIFILAVFLALRTKYVWYALIIGVIGQLSMVDTFAHLHTSLDISLRRVFYGMLIGAILGVLLIMAWTFVKRGWQRWTNSEQSAS